MEDEQDKGYAGTLYYLCNFPVNMQFFKKGFFFFKEGISKQHLLVQLT